MTSTTAATGLRNNELVQIEQIDPMALDLGTADVMATIDRASLTAAGLEVPPPVGASRLSSLQLGSDSRPVDGLWLATEGGSLVGYACVELPWRDNTGSAHLRGVVDPGARHRGVGRALLGAAMSMSGKAGRSMIYAGAYEGSDGVPALEALGFSREGQGVNAVRRVDVHGSPSMRWDELYDEALTRAGEYALVHQVGPTPEEMVEDMVSLHDAINDAPLDDPEEEEPAVFDADRIRCYDQAMAGRSQTLYRVMARHRSSREWAGLSLLCVDEHMPRVAFQEDTSVVRAHRGHRLGLLMKTDMLRWIQRERPDVAAVDTWNATSNHHMIAVNERLGATVVARHVGFRLREAP